MPEISKLTGLRIIVSDESIASYESATAFEKIPVSVTYNDQTKTYTFKDFLGMLGFTTKPTSELVEALVQAVCQIEASEGRKISRLDIVSDYVDPSEAGLGAIEYTLLDNGEITPQEKIREGVKDALLPRSEQLLKRVVITQAEHLSAYRDYLDHLYTQARTIINHG